MNVICKLKFWIKCFCEMEFEYMKFFLNCDRVYPMCNILFIIKQYQDNTQIQIKKLEDKLGKHQQ
jgi:hypothetical protein